jgi:hypothetical protein
MSDYLLTGHVGPLTLDECTSIQSIADALAGAGLHGVKLVDLEWAAVRNALIRADGNRTHASKMLGISVRTLQRKLKANGCELGGAVIAPSPQNRPCEILQTVDRLTG